MKNALRLLVMLAGAALVVGGMVIPGESAYGEGDIDQAEVARARRATAKYHDVAVAMRDGYQRLGPCVSKGDTAVGYHYTNLELVNDGVVDAEKPEILIYFPSRQGGLRLVALEYFKADADGDLATDDDKPSLFDVEFVGPIPPSAPGQPNHYEMHAWIWAKNPDGTFAHFNENLQCPPPPPGERTGPPPGMGGTPPPGMGGAIEPIGAGSHSH